MLFLSLVAQTKQLIEECNYCIKRFYKMREEDRAPHFFDEVKPHADTVHLLTKEWQQQANEWIAKHQPKYLHSQQITAAVEAINQFVVQSFYKETSKKRFVQSVQSALYTCDTLLRYLQGGELDAFKKKND